MSNQYPGGIITKNPATPTGPFDIGAAPGIWTLTQQAVYKQQGVWPTAGLSPNYIEDVFSTYLYTGNGTTQTITNGVDLSTKGGFVWLKYRSGSAGSSYHHVYDSARGKSGNASYNYLYPNASDPQGTGAFGPTSFNTTGFTLNGYLNESSIPYVSWTWAKQPKFFDVVTWTGNSTNRTIAHNLGSVPACIIVKQTDSANNWAVYHRSIGNTKYLNLNLTSAQATASNFWNNTDPTSSVFTVGTDGEVNFSGATYVAYLFAHDAGGFGLTGTDNVISCGSLTTSGTAGLNSVTLGYEPQFVMLKRTDATQPWLTLDVMRGMSNTSYAELYPNNSNAESASSSYSDVVPTATGFQLNTNTSGYPTTSSTYIYIAIRRGPMKVPTTGTSVFSPIASSDSQGTQQTTGFPVDLQIAAYRPGNANNSTANDRLRGVSSTSTGNTNTPLVTSSTAAETAGGIGTQGWNNTGFGIPAFLSISSSIYWNFRRAPSFMDVVCYTGTGSARTVSHNLAAVPELMIVKARANARNWIVYSASTGNAGHLILNDNSAYAANSADWDNTSPTSSVFTVGGNYTVNDLNAGMVAYLFATCSGVSKVGSYTGTATTKQIDCGFTAGARFVLIKRTDSTGDWYVWDTARGIVSGNDSYLLLNSTAAEVTNTDYVDTYSAGFEISSTAPAAINASGGTYIFLAIA